MKEGQSKNSMTQTGVIASPPKPKCFLKWEGDTEGIQFGIYRDFNWFQRKMLKWCFGLDYKKI